MCERVSLYSAPTHHSPLFLDCCGLVRKVLRDLKEEFGFTIGPWNQAYQVCSAPGVCVCVCVCVCGI